MRKNAALRKNARKTLCFALPSRDEIETGLSFFNIPVNMTVLKFYEFFI
jgi:hypothetical protein